MKTSVDIAKERLHTVLVSDRLNCNPETIELIRKDIIKTVSKYMQVDSKRMQFEIIEQKNTQNTYFGCNIYASIPIIEIK